MRVYLSTRLTDEIKKTSLLQVDDINNYWALNKSCLKSVPLCSSDYVSLLVTSFNTD